MAQTLSAQKQYTNGSITSLTPGCECLGPAANRHGMSQSWARAHGPPAIEPCKGLPIRDSVAHCVFQFILIVVASMALKRLYFMDI